jgi:hypothetical protein
VSSRRSGADPATRLAAPDSVICTARWHHRVTRHVGWAIAEPSAGMLAAPLTVEVNEYSAGLVGQLDEPVGDG